MDTRPHPVAASTLAADPWPAATWLHRSEGFAEDLAPPARPAPAVLRRDDWGLGMVRRLVRLGGLPMVAAGVRPAVLRPA